MKTLDYLKNILHRCKSIFYSKSKYVKQIDIPYEIDNKESIARFIFSPININVKTNKLKSNCLKPPVGSDEISVNRFDYADKPLLKKIATKMQSPQKNYYGLAIMNAGVIRENNFEIVYTPIKNKNPYHSDIKIGYIVEKDVELPAEISAQIREILKNTSLQKDLDTI